MTEFLAAVGKLDKKCVVAVNPERFQCIVPDSRGMQLWSGVPLATLFEECKVESLNNNLVAFEMVVENFERAVKSAQYSTECVCKLAKKDGQTYLTFVIEIQTQQVMNVIQDVPIKLMSAAAFGLMMEPPVPDPTVHISLPSLKQLKPIIDRLKGLADVLSIECNYDGTLKLGVATDSAKITTVMTGLDHPRIEGYEGPPRNADIWASVRVDMKNFSRFLGASNVGPDHVICCVVVHKVVVMHVLLDQLYLTYYLPILAGT